LALSVELHGLCLHGLTALGWDASQDCLSI
jgi:hypothetical protein